MLLENWYLSSVKKKIQATPTEQNLGTSGGLSKISDAHPRPFYMEVPTGVSGSCDVALTV